LLEVTVKLLPRQETELDQSLHQDILLIDE